MLAWAVAALATLAVAGTARACELDGLFGLRFGQAVPQQLALRQVEQPERSWLGVITFTFRPAAAEPGFEPLKASATGGGRRLLVQIQGVARRETAVAAKEQLTATLATFTERHRCRFQEDHRWLVSDYPEFNFRDTEAHVSLGSKSVTIAQRDGARVVLRVRSTRTFEIVGQDPLKD